MANTLDGGSFKEYWSRRQQRQHFKVDVFRAFVSFEEQSNLKEGDTVNRPYRSVLRVRTYTRGTAVTIQDLTNTNEQLSINQSKIIPFYVDDLDALQSSYKDMNEYADDCGVLLGNDMDGVALGEIANATPTLSDADITPGGTAGAAIEVTTANVFKLFSAANKKLFRKNAKLNSLIAVISPDVHQVLVDYLQSKNSNLGDSTGLNGHVGTYGGFQIYISNALYFTCTLAIATDPANLDTVTLNNTDPNAGSVTITFRTTIGVLTGSVLRGTSAAASSNGFISCITGVATGGLVAGTDYVALSAADADKLNAGTQGNLTAALVSTNINITVKGLGFLLLTSSLTAAADGWTSTKQIQHCAFLRKGAVEGVIQREPKIEIKDVPDKLGKNILVSDLYGFKTFAEGKVEMVDVKVGTSTYAA